MADEKFDKIRLALMQDFLPIALATLSRVRKGGVSSVIEVINESTDPLDDLRKEGDISAKNFREKLDDFSPGLGNPVVSVDVDIKEQSTSDQIEDKQELLQVLNRIESRLNQLDHFLEENTVESSCNS